MKKPSPLARNGDGLGEDAPKRAKKPRGRPASPTSLHGARTRKENALARLREIEVALKEGQIVEVTEVERRWSDILRRVRSGMLAVPSRVRAQLPHLSAADAARIDREIRTVLTILGNGDDTLE